jgi:flagellar biosynthesis anti-sigma factor FlgM
MTGLEGINSLERALGTMGVKETRATDAAKTTSAQVASTTAQSANRSTDQTSVSSAGGLVAQMVNSSDVRTEKVAQLQATIASGSYNVPASAVADKLVDHLLNR